MFITHDCKHHILYEWSSKKKCYEWMTWLPSPLLGMTAFSTIGNYCPLCDDSLWYNTNVVRMPQQPSWLLQDAIPICIAIYMCILFVNWYIEIEYNWIQRLLCNRESDYILSFLDLVSLYISFNLQQFLIFWWIRNIIIETNKQKLLKKQNHMQVTNNKEKILKKKKGDHVRDECVNKTTHKKSQSLIWEKLRSVHEQNVKITKFAHCFSWQWARNKPKTTLKNKKTTHYVCTKLPKILSN